MSIWKTKPKVAHWHLVFTDTDTHMDKDFKNGTADDVLAELNEILLSRGLVATKVDEDTIEIHEIESGRRRGYARREET